MALSLRLSALALLFLASSPPPARGSPPTLHTGDLAFIRSKSSRSELIQRASHSPYSHVGVVEVTDGGIFVIEAIQPVSRTPWNRFVARADHRRVTVARVTGLDTATLERVVTTAKANLGKGYDARYRWDDERLYCSELVVKAFARGAEVSLGRRQRVRELALSAAELALAQTLGIAPDTELVTPGSLLEGDRVQVVARDVAW
jgi:hypothetical protein